MSALQTLTLAGTTFVPEQIEGFDSLESLEGLSGCTALQTLTLDRLGTALETLRHWRDSLAARRCRRSSWIASASSHHWRPHLRHWRDCCTALQTLTLWDLKSLASLEVLSGCTALQTLRLSTASSRSHHWRSLWLQAARRCSCCTRRLSSESLASLRSSLAARRCSCSSWLPRLARVVGPLWLHGAADARRWRTSESLGARCSSWLLWLHGAADAHAVEPQQARVIGGTLWLHGAADARR